MTSTLLDRTKSTLEQYKLRADSIHFGQHFLTDEATVRLFVQKVIETAPATVLEIGPGLGILTTALAPHVSSLTAVEIDTRLQSVLDIVVKKNSTVHVLYKNILKFENFAYDMICGCLSYVVFEPLMRKLIFHTEMKKGVFIVSAKFAHEFEKRESLLTIMADTFFTVSFIKLIEKNLFYPVPREAGVLITLERRGKTDVYHRLWRELFLQSDKKLKNALRETLILYALERSARLTKKNSTASIVNFFNAEKLDNPLFQTPRRVVLQLKHFLLNYINKINTAKTV